MQENSIIILILILIIIILSFIVIILFLRKNKDIQYKRIFGALKQINEFASHQYVYTDKIEYKKSLPVPILNFFINRSASLVVIGNVKIGINLENILIDKTINNFNIEIPELIIIGHELEIGDVGIQSKNILYQHDLIEYNQFLTNWKKEKEKEILNDKNIISKAYKDLQNIITELLIASNVSNIQKINYSKEEPKLLLLPEVKMEK